MLGCKSYTSVTRFFFLSMYHPSHGIHTLHVYLMLQHVNLRKQVDTAIYISNFGESIMCFVVLVPDLCIIEAKSITTSKKKIVLMFCYRNHSQICNLVIEENAR